MGIKVAINGYGRIGRQVLRAIYDYNLQDQLEVVAVNASGSLETNAHLTKFDTVHGRFNADISHDATHLIINGRKIPFFSTRNPAELPWRDLGVDLVMECTGSFTSKSKANVHLESGAKKVLISAPGEADVDATIVYGVNDDVITDDMTVISNASCTTNCLAPVAKVLSENIGIVKGAMTTIHALIQADPEGKTYYQQRLGNYQVQLKKLHSDAQAAFNAVPAAKRKVLTGHDAFSYMGKRYNIEFIAPQGVSNEAEPSAKQVASIIRQIKREGIKAVFTENIKDTRMVDRIAKETGVNVSGKLYSDALGGAPANTYIGMYRYNVKALTDAMKK